jgi:aminoglycoside phosphotransferase (APT) family kinase protein
LLHGDLQLYNVIAAGDRVSGIIDWEWAHGGEPDFDLADLIRWTFYPEDPAEEELESSVDATTYALLPPTLLAAYPEVAAVPRLAERLTIYLLEYDLHQLSQWSHAPDKPRRRLDGWLQGKLGEYISPR